MEYLSDIELYYSKSVNEAEKILYLSDEEAHHSTKVMRNKIGDSLFASDGKGRIYKGIIKYIHGDSLTVDITETLTYKNYFEHFTICIPNLKNPDRIKFAFEKCTEMGITKFILFNSERTISKSPNLIRINKILLAAMKQSLRAYLPEVIFANSLSEIKKIKAKKILFDQKSKDKLSPEILDKSLSYLLIFGPEGGFTDKELSLIKPDFNFNIAVNRLRSETAIVKAASILSLNEKID